MSNFLNDFLYIHKRERNGTLVLCLLALLILLLPTLYKLVVPAKVYTFPDFPIEEQVAPKTDDQPSAVAYAPKTINPNTASKTELMQVGFPKKLANTIVNYRNKGGQFFRPSDLKKIYGMTDETYQKVLPWIQTDQPQKQFVSHKKPDGFSNNDKDTYYKDNKKPFHKKEKKPVVITPPTAHFDPNTAFESDFLAMGIPPKVVNTVLNFRKKGGQFRQPEDFMMIYGMKKAWYDQLASKIIIQTKQAVSTQELTTLDTPKDNYPVKSEKILLDINTATKEEFKQLHGIGPYYARKITVFRDKLGGFASVEQVKETYALPDSVAKKIIPHLRHSPIFRKVLINTATMETLRDHPYIKHKQAELIVKYRNEHGPYQSMADVAKIRAFKREFLEKIEPYLSFETDVEKR